MFVTLAIVCYRNPKTGIRCLALLTPFWIEFRFPALSGVRIGHVDVIVVAATLALLCKTERDPVPRNRILFLLPFIGYNIFTIMANMTIFEQCEPGKVRWMLYKLISFSMIYVVVIKHADDEQTVLETVKCFLFAAVVMAFFAVLQRPLGNQFNPFAVGTYAEEITSSWGQENRVIGALRSPNELAAFLLWPLCIMTGITLNYKGRTLLPHISLLVMILALLLTYSRTGWIVYLLSFSLIGFLCQRKSLVVGIFVLLVCSVFILPELFPGLGGTFLNRLKSIQKRSDDLAMIARIERREYYSEQVRNNPLGLGVVPTGTFAEAAQPHNNFLYLSLMAGIPGMVCAMLLLAGIIVTAYRNYLCTTNPLLKGTFAGIFAAGVGFILQSFYESLWQNFQMGVLLWLLFGVTAAYNGITRNRHEDLART